MPYFGKVEDGQGLVLETVKIVYTLNYDVWWRNETDGKESFVARAASIDKPASAAMKKRAQAKLDELVRRYTAYAEREGKRYEVVQHEKRVRKERIRLAPRDAVNEITAAARAEHQAKTGPAVVLGKNVRELSLAELTYASTALLVEIRHRAEASAKRGATLELPLPH